MEIGVAVLDTRDLSGGGCPKDTTKDLISKTKNAHYRILEQSKLRNRNFVKSCETGFNFGTTQWIHVRDIGNVLNRIFFDPSRLHEAANFDVTIKDERRNIVFVCHGLSNISAKNNKSYMDQRGFRVATNPSVVRKVDTKLLAGGKKA